MESQLKCGELHKQDFFRSVGERFTMNFLLKKPKKERKKRKEERKIEIMKIRPVFGLSMDR